MLGALCGFTILAAAWLFTMFIVLRHPGFEWRAAVCALIIAQSVATLLLLRHSVWPALRFLVAVGAVGMGVFAGWTFVQNSAAGPGDFEGYTAVITSGLVLQAILTLDHVFRRRGVGRAAPARTGTSGR
ncbi:MAG: hypothetical protein IMZ67_01700 [Acidobacteria bacterium]|nr:hypothetical protein [Acidobacteriota bacterium]